MHISETSLDLQPGDWIIWQDEEIKAEGTVTFVAPGMVGKVLSRYPKESMREAVSEMVGHPIGKRVLVEFENGMRILMDPEMKWKRMLKQ